METKRENESKSIIILKRIFLVFVSVICLYFVLGQVFLSNEREIGEGEYRTFSEGWMWIKEDGTREEIEIPGNCGAKRNELVVVENVLPEDVQDNIFLCIRSSKQETKIYIDGELRQQYTTEDTRPFGKVSAVAWVFVELTSEDAGKEIRMELQTDSSYTGAFYDIHYGDRWEIWTELFRTDGGGLIIGLLMLVLGILSVVIGSILKVIYKKNIEMEYLAWAIFLTAVWILSNSVFRQLLFPSVSVISDMGFFMLMLIPIPFMLYLNSVQGERYKTVYAWAVGLSLADIVVCTTLHVFNLVDFSDTNKLMCVVAGLAIVTMVVTLIRDICIGKIREYKLAAFGIGVICATAVIEILIYFVWTNQFSGSVMAAGLVFILIISFVNTINNILIMEKEKQEALISNETKGKFLANMSHEIRTPINAVLGMDAMILRECQDDSIREYALNIQNAGQTLLSLINDILDFSKIESGKMEIIPVEYDFSSMIHDVANMIIMRAKDKGLQMNLTVDSTLPCKVYGDEVRIRQVLVNLLTNAVKYTKEGSMGLTVNGKREGEEILLSFTVEDTGIGIKAEDIQKLFARFERIEEERNRNIEGTGLGMSITMQLLKLMDSELKVESEYGVGSKFSFEIRQRIVVDEPIGNLEERIKSLSSEYTYEAAFSAPEAHILVVDDNAINRKVFRNLLKQTKVKVDEAESGIECLELVQQNHYDLIFLDHMMPEMDGVETLHHMKEIDDYPCKTTPVIALTANAICGAREMYLKEGFNEFLSKPIQPEKLEKMIKEWLPKDLILKGMQMVEDEEKVEVSLPEIEGIDWNSALAHLPDKDLLMQTIYDFYSTLDGEADFLQNCYENLKNDDTMLESYRIKVHAMKSSAALIGIKELSEKAKMLELAAADGNKELIYEETEAFLKEWRAYKTKLAICITETAKEEVKDFSVVKEKLELLKDAMDMMDIDMADEIMKELRGYQYSEAINEKVESLGAAVVNLDVEKANKVINEIEAIL